MQRSFAVRSVNMGKAKEDRTFRAFIPVGPNWGPTGHNWAQLGLSWNAVWDLVPNIFPTGPLYIVSIHIHDSATYTTDVKPHLSVANNTQCCTH